MRKPHLAYSHNYIRQHLHEDGVAIDATCGNGHDTLLLAQIATKGVVIAMDCQASALKSAKALIESHSPDMAARILWQEGCHSEIGENMASGSVDLIVYNLGYLPGGDKSVITKTETTLKSLNRACALLKQGGAILVTTYSGHEGGQPEEEAVVAFARQLPKQEYLTEQHLWLNREKGPTVLSIKKMASP